MKIKYTIILLLVGMLASCSSVDKKSNVETSSRQDTTKLKKQKPLSIVDCESLKKAFKRDSIWDDDTISFIKFKNIIGFSPTKLKGQDSLLIIGTLGKSPWFKNCKEFILHIVSKNNLDKKLYTLALETDSNCNIIRYIMKKVLNQETGGCEMFDFFVKSDSLEKIIISIPTPDYYTFKDYLELKRKYMNK
ncbi:MAG TPA: hypothetical protein VF411_15570 [Bacteroidia bacterium]